MLFAISCDTDNKSDEEEEVLVIYRSKTKYAETAPMTHYGHNIYIVDTHDVKKLAKTLDAFLSEHPTYKLVSVVEKEINGKLISRFFRFWYILADGREIKRGDYDPDFKEYTTEAQDEELISLLDKNEFVTIGYEEKEFRGRMFSFKRNRFVLSDGTIVIWSVGRPSENSQSNECNSQVKKHARTHERCQCSNFPLFL